jgi:hypothetical protein
MQRVLLLRRFSLRTLCVLMATRRFVTVICVLWAGIAHLTNNKEPRASSRPSTMASETKQLQALIFSSIGLKTKFLFPLYLNMRISLLTILVSKRSVQDKAKSQKSLIISQF